jgi:hypothetical protein
VPLQDRYLQLLERLEGAGFAAAVVFPLSPPVYLEKVLDIPDSAVGSKAEKGHFHLPGLPGVGEPLP